jgi:prepilin signal peptidase PulO-like enzyme (type II secretory pathway)
MNQTTELWIDGGLFFLILLPLVVSDIKFKKIPDIYIFVGLIVLTVRRIVFTSSPSLWFLVDAAIGFGFIFVFWYFSKRKIGLGDAKLSGLIALMLGIPAWILSLFLASVAGIVYGGVRMARGTMQRTDRIPFAPFLGAGALVGFTHSLLFGRMSYGFL